MPNNKLDQRKIIHIDMDAFFASVEQRDCPDLQGKPVAVGSAEGRGVVAAASYEARVFGVRSAMPSVTAARLCKDLIFVRARFDAYRAVSQQIHEIFSEFTPLIEPLSLDEAYLDVTEDLKGIGSATLVAQQIRDLIFERTQLTASAGVSYNKFLAKIASDLNKPNGLATILPDQAEGFLEKLPVREFHGIGKATAQKMYDMNIYKGVDLKALSLTDMVARFGKTGHYYYHVVRGVDDREVNPNRIRKSVSVEETFSENKKSIGELREVLSELVERLMVRVKKAEVSGYTVILKIKYEDFEIISRRVTAKQLVKTKEEVMFLAERILAQIKLRKSVRLIGIGMSNLQDEGEGEDIKQPQFDF